MRKNFGLTKNKEIILLLLILFSAVTFRGVFITADPPTSISISGAPIGDAGQHSYGARNKILFNQWNFYHWKPYVWSPILNVPVSYWIYKTFGINYTTHRIVPVIFSSLLLIVFLIVIYKSMGFLTAMFATVFISYNYPLIIFSKIANRYLPVTFFFFISIIFFYKGTEKKSNGLFFLSGLFMSLALFTQLQVTYFLVLYAVMSILWWIEKKISFKNILSFWIVIAAAIGLWYLIIYIPAQDYLALIGEHNKLVRKLGSIAKLLKNIINSPFLFQFRSDFISLFLSILGIFWAAYLKLKKKKLNLLVELAVFGLLCGVCFHSIWGYRPTRFYIILIPFVAILSGWILNELWQNRMKIKINLAVILAVLLVLFSLVVFGLNRFTDFIKNSFISQPVITLLFSLVIFGLIFLIFFMRRNRKKLIKIAVSGFLILNFLISSTYFYSWVRDLQFNMVNISKVLNSLLPPTVMAGNWASILSISTPHKTFLLSNEMKVNWEKDFLKKNNVKYLLLTQGRFGNELGAYVNFFKKEFKQVRVLAIFRLYNTPVYLIKLNTIDEKLKSKLEIETFRRHIGQVKFNSEASGKLVLNISNKNFSKTGNLDLVRNNVRFQEGENELHLCLQGKGAINLVVKRGNQIALNIRKSFNNPRLKNQFIGKINNSDQTAKYSVEIKILRINQKLCLDAISIKTDQNIP